MQFSNSPTFCPEDHFVDFGYLEALIAQQAIQALKLDAQLANGKKKSEEHAEMWCALVDLGYQFCI